VVPIGTLHRLVGQPDGPWAIPGFSSAARQQVIRAAPYSAPAEQGAALFLALVSRKALSFFGSILGLPLAGH
jgi:hypothetical protein